MRFGNLFSRYRAVSKWSGLLAAIAMALLTVAASAQMVGSEKGKKHRDTQKTEDQAKKKKVDEKAYEDALKSIPPSSEKSDPWKSRSQNPVSNSAIITGDQKFKTAPPDC